MFDGSVFGLCKCTMVSFFGLFGHSIDWCAWREVLFVSVVLLGPSLSWSREPLCDVNKGSGDGLDGVGKG